MSSMKVVHLLTFLSICHFCHSNWFGKTSNEVFWYVDYFTYFSFLDRVTRFKSVPNGSLRDVSFSAFNQEWQIRLWPNTLFHSSNEESSQQSSTYWIGTLLGARNSDCSVTLDAEGTIFSAHILYPNGRQLRITRVANFVETQADFRAEVLDKLKNEDLVIFDVKGHTYAKRQASGKGQSRS